MIKIYSLLIFIFLILGVLPAYSEEIEKEPLTLEEALKIYSTPFIDDYRARYKASNRSPALVMATEHNCTNFPRPRVFKIPCTQQDIDNIKKLAWYGDGASLELAFYFIDDNLYSEYMKRAADAGVLEGLMWYGAKVGRKDLTMGKEYLKKAKAFDDIQGYKVLAGLYSYYKMHDEFCAIMDAGYKKFGFEFIAMDLLVNKSRQQPSLREQYPEVCLGMTADGMLNKINTYESKLVKALRYFPKQEYKKAKKLLQEIYNKSNNNDLKQNAGFCLGAMYYSGTAVKEDKKYGLKLMKEAADAGYITFFNDIPGIQMMPDKYKMINLYSRYCEALI